MTYEENKSAIYSALDIMTWAEKDWDGLPDSIRNLDEVGMNWIAAALASEGIGKAS